MIEVGAKKALEIIEPIPPEDFIIYMYQEGDSCRRCVLGHIQHAISGDALSDSDGFGLRSKSERFLKEKHEIAADITAVNNGNNINGYNEPVIKDRVVHFLKDMVEAGY